MNYETFRFYGSAIVCGLGLGAVIAEASFGGPHPYILIGGLFLAAAGFCWQWVL